MLAVIEGLGTRLNTLLVWNVNFEAWSGLGTKVAQRKSGRVCREDDFAFIHAQGICLLVEFGIVALYLRLIFMAFIRYSCYTASFFWSVLANKFGDSLTIITFSGWF